MRRIILVTGGAGFIGSNIVARLTGDPRFDVVVSDWMGDARDGKWRNLAKHAIADVVAPEDALVWLGRRWRDVEAVVHIGAISSTTDPDVDRILRTNFGTSRDLFRWCADHGRRLIYASSAATYGDGALGFDDDHRAEALAALRPLNAYGWSKALFDLFAAREAASGRAPPQWAGLKFFNVYGPNEDHKGPMKSVAAQMWPDVAAGRPARLFKSYREGCPNGGQQRDFIYVRDAVDVVAWLIDRPDVSGIFNLGTGQARTFNDVARAAFAAAGRTAQIEYFDMPPELRDRYQYATEAKMERLRAAGYDGQFASLEDGISDYVRAFLSQPDRYR